MSFISNSAKELLLKGALDLTTEAMSMIPLKTKMEAVNAVEATTITGGGGALYDDGTTSGTLGGLDLPLTGKTVSIDTGTDTAYFSADPVVWASIDAASTDQIVSVVIVRNSDGLPIFHIDGGVNFPYSPNGAQVTINSASGKLFIL